MKKRTIIGGLVGTGALLGLLIGRWWPNFNLGGWGLGGKGNVAVTSTADSTMAASDRGKQPEVESARSEEPKNEEVDHPTESAKEPDTVLHVLIDGRQFLVKQRIGDGWEYQPVTPEKLVELARAAKGDEDGIRVRIARRGSARATTEIALRDRLLEAGLTDESMRWQEGLVP